MSGGRVPTQVTHAERGARTRGRWCRVTRAWKDDALSSPSAMQNTTAKACSVAMVDQTDGWPVSSSRHGTRSCELFVNKTSSTSYGTAYLAVCTNTCSALPPYKGRNNK